MQPLRRAYRPAPTQPRAIVNPKRTALVPFQKRIELITIIGKFIIKSQSLIFLDYQ